MDQTEKAVDVLAANNNRLILGVRITPIFVITICYNGLLSRFIIYVIIIITIIVIIVIINVIIIVNNYPPKWRWLAVDIVLVFAQSANRYGEFRF